MKDRSILIRELARLERPVIDVMTDLQNYDWNCDAELYVLTILDVRNVMKKYLDNEISASELSTWADKLEMREDLDYEDGRNKEIATLLFNLSSPEINQPITKENIQKLTDEIN